MVAAASRTLLALALTLGVAACTDPVFPRSVVPTLDDAGGTPGEFLDVATGLEHTCALRADSTAACWGSNEFGQLGRAPGTTTCSRADRNIPCERSPRIVPGGLKFEKLSAGANHTCGLAVDWRVYCWGGNQLGQIGDPAVIQSPTPVPIISAFLFVDLAAGEDHTCALRTDNVAFCWGSNDYGELGTGVSGAGSAVPALVQTNLRFASIAAGLNRTCGRVGDGSVYCWGSTWVSRRADGVDVVRAQPAPARVLPAPEFQWLTVGGNTTCALELDGAARCWESNAHGTMGDATTRGSLIPQGVITSERFVSIVAGARHTCAIAATGYVHCWGSGELGQLGISPGTIGGRCAGSPCFVSPNRISGWRTFAKLGAGAGSHACGVTPAGNLYCWGAGSMGQRGDGSRSSFWSPTRVLTPVV